MTNESQVKISLRGETVNGTADMCGTPKKEMSVKSDKKGLALILRTVHWAVKHNVDVTIEHSVNTNNV